MRPRKIVLKDARAEIAGLGVGPRFRRYDTCQNCFCTVMDMILPKGFALA